MTYLSNNFYRCDFIQFTFLWHTAHALHSSLFDYFITNSNNYA